MPITQIISPKGVQTRSRRSSMFGVYRKGGIRLIDIPVTPDSKKASPPKGRTRRTSMYQKDASNQNKPKNNRRTSTYQKKEVDPKPPTRRTRRQNKEQTQVKDDIKEQQTTNKSVALSPVISLVDIVSPKKQANKSQSDSVIQTPSPVRNQGKLQKSISETFKTPKVPDSVKLSSKKESVKRSTRKASTKKASAMERMGKTPRTARKGTIPMEADESSMLITFKTPAVSGRKSARKRKAEVEVSPPAKKCILDLSPVEKVPFKTPHKLDKSPVLMLTRTPLVDMLTSTPRDLIPSLKTPLRPLSSSGGKKSLKHPKSTLSKTKRVSIVSDLKTPDSTRKSLTTRRRGTPAKVISENLENSMKLDESSVESNSMTILKDSKVFPEPTNITILSEKASIVTDSNNTVNTTSHSSNGRCTIL